MNIYKNFLPKKDFQKIKNYMLSDSMPWYFSDEIVDNNFDYFQFSYGFILKGSQNCNDFMMELINPIIKKIKTKNFYRIKANLLTKTKKIEKHPFHIDQATGTTGIYYLNNCNGYTEFKNNKKIKSEENKYVEFNSKLLHRGTSCTDKKIRIVINFNYEPI
tara:strand:- start:50 stop:532 length:483 start_codon:yes stop_codon:yes gene_type:complete